MKHLYRNIPGMMDYEVLYTQMVDKFPSGSHFIEVGVWRGRSAAYMAVEIVNSHKRIHLDVIDNFKKSPILVVKKNLSQFDFVRVIQGDSSESAKRYQDGSLEFVFIDADHSTKSIIRDIKAWLPKVKSRGILAGHDYGNEQYPELKVGVDSLLKVKKTSVMCWYYEK